MAPAPTSARPPASIDILSNKATLKFEESRRLLASWLPAPTGKATNFSSPAVISARSSDAPDDEDDLFKNDQSPELLGIGATVSPTPNGSAPTSQGSDHAQLSLLRKQLLGGKTQRGHTKHPPGVPFTTTRPNQQQQQSKKPPPKAIASNDDDDDDDREGRSSLGGPKKKRKPRMNLSPDIPASIPQVTTAQPPPDAADPEGSTHPGPNQTNIIDHVNDSENPQPATTSQAAEEDWASPTKRSPSSKTYLDEILAERERKRRKKERRRQSQLLPQQQQGT